MLRTYAWLKLSRTDTQMNRHCATIRARLACASRAKNYHDWLSFVRCLSWHGSGDATAAAERSNYRQTHSNERSRPDAAMHREPNAAAAAAAAADGIQPQHDSKLHMCSLVSASALHPSARRITFRGPMSLCKIYAWSPLTTYRKLYTESRTVTWLMTSRDCIIIWGLTSSDR